MSWFTVGEIVVWLMLAAGLGAVLGWLAHEIWNRSRPSQAPPEEPVTTDEPTTEPTPITERAADRRIKGNRKSMIYHAPGSPAYERTHADAWFDSEDDAVAAGYRMPRNR